MTTTKPNDTGDEIALMISDCQNRESKLSDWERSFIDSVEQQVSKGRSLTDKQLETLEKLWEKVT